MGCTAEPGEGGGYSTATLLNVKTSAHGRHYDPDARAPMTSLPTMPSSLVDFEVQNLTQARFVQLLHAACRQGSRVDSSDTSSTTTTTTTTTSSSSSSVFFTALPQSFTQQHLSPTRPLFLTSDDHKLHRQFAWVSTGGSVTHTHFDQDYNVFVQLVGSKRFTLFAPSQARFLAPFSRLHPLWHKSKANFARPALDIIPEYAHARAVTVDVHAGDVLYIPPYVWHRVETLSPVSLSLSTLSHDDATRGAMDAIYRMDHKFDRLRHHQGRVFALRVYIDLLVHDMVGNHPDEVRRFASDLVDRRYRGLTQYFPRRSSSNGTSVCQARVPNKIPTAHHVFGDCNTDKALVVSHFAELRPEIRDFLFEEYIEDLVQEVVGVARVLDFFHDCFQGQGYYLTHIGDEEHELWDYKSDAEDEGEGEDEGEDEGEEESENEPMHET